MPKSKQYIQNIQIVAEMDIREGRLESIKQSLKDRIEMEDYETCEGLSKAINKRLNN